MVDNKFLIRKRKRLPHENGNINSGNNIEWEGGAGSGRMMNLTKICIFRKVMFRGGRKLLPVKRRVRESLSNIETENIRYIARVS